MSVISGIPLSRKSRHWPRSLALGLLWGVGVSAMEAVSLPLQDEYWSSFWLLVFWIIPGWSAVGVGIAVLIEFAGARVGGPFLVVASIIGCAVALAAFYSWIYSLDSVQGLVSGMSTVFPRGTDPLASFAYQTWVVLFYGGFYFVAWRMNHRAERTRELLVQAEIARVQAGSLLGETQLQSLRGHVDPRFLLRVMAEVERRYAHSASRADNLLVLLVAFLRLAMPAVRSGRSTLAGELALARAYGKLWADLEPERTNWAISGEPPPNVPFPALLMLPLLDQHAAASTSPFLGSVSVTSEADAIVIRFFGEPVERADWISADLSYRIRVSLSTLYGDAWSISQHETATATDPALVIVLRPRPAVNEAPVVVDAGFPVSKPKGACP